MTHGRVQAWVKHRGSCDRALSTVGIPARLPLRRHWCVEIRFVAFQSNMEIGATEAECGNARTAWVVGRSRPFERLCGDKERNVVPINGGVGSFKIGAWWNGSVVQSHDRLHDACDARSSLEVANLGFDGANGDFPCTFYAGPQA